MLDEVTLPQANPVHNMEVLLHSLLLFREQVAIMVRRVFEQVYLDHQLCLLLDQQTLFTVTLALGTPSLTTVIHRAALEEYPV